MRSAKASTSPFTAKAWPDAAPVLFLPDHWARILRGRALFFSWPGSLLQSVSERPAAHGTWQVAHEPHGMPHEEALQRRRPVDRRQPGLAREPQRQ